MRRPEPWLILALLLASPAAWATPLDPEACKSLKAEHEGLVADGAKSDMAKGVAWAEKNLKPERLAKISRLIAVEENLSFRCGQMVTAAPAMKELPKDDVAGSASGKRLSRIPLPVKKKVATAGAAAKNAKKK